MHFWREPEVGSWGCRENGKSQKSRSVSVHPVLRRDPWMYSGPQQPLCHTKGEAEDRILQLHHCWLPGQETVWTTHTGRICPQLLSRVYMQTQHHAVLPAPCHSRSKNSSGQQGTYISLVPCANSWQGTQVRVKKVGRAVGLGSLPSEWPSRLAGCRISAPVGSTPSPGSGTGTVPPPAPSSSDSPSWSSGQIHL